MARRSTDSDDEASMLELLEAQSANATAQMQEHADRLLEELAGYQPDDLLAVAGALQLVPANAHRAVRLQAFACFCAWLPSANGDGRISTNRLQSLLSLPPFGEGAIKQSEDPYEGVFVGSIAFFGGDYLALTGATDEDIYALDQLFHAVFKKTEPFPCARFSQEIYPTIRSALALSDLMCDQADLQRGMTAPPWDRAVIIPAHHELLKLKNAVCIRVDSLDSSLSRRGGSVTSLQPLIVDRGAFKISDYRPAEGPILMTPLVRSGELMLIAAPSLLVYALQHLFLRNAVRHDCVLFLAQRFHEAVRERIRRNLRALGHREGPLELPDPIGVDFTSELFFEFDTDKLAHVLIVTDSFATYDPENPFKAWSSSDLNDRLRQRINEARKHIMALSNAPSVLFSLVFVQGIGGAGFYGFEVDEEFEASDFLFMQASSLEHVCSVERNDPLALWKFARVRKHTSERITIMTIGELNAFGFYRKQRHSFYRDDLPLGGLLSLSPGFAGEVMVEAAERYDRHGSLSFHPDRTIPVVLAHGTRTVPIYIPDGPEHQVPAFMVEGYDRPLWVVAPEPGEGEGWLLHFQLCELLAYWFWQLTPDIREATSNLSSRASCITLHVRTVADGDIAHAGTLSPNDQSSPPEVITRSINSDTGMVDVIIKIGLQGQLDGPTNEGELAIVRPVVCGVLQLCGVGAANEIAGSAIARHAVDRLKKKLTVLSLQAMPELDGNGLPTFRPLQQPDEGMVLDDIGDFLRLSLGFQEGTIPSERHTKVLREVVGYLYQRLERLVAELTPTGLLEWLISQHESALSVQAHQRLNSPTRIACFGQECAVAIREEMKQAVEACIAVRFVIEYVAARPPIGNRTISLSVYDELMMLASLIFSFGSESDLIYFGIAKIPMQILGSGRLGADRKDYEPAFQAYSSALAAGQIAAAERAFQHLWNKSPDRERVPPPEVVQLNDAATAEFGFSMAEFSDLLAEAVNLAHEQPAVTVKSSDAFKLELSEALQWPVAKVDTCLQRLMLTERSDYLKPPGPATRRDVEPWNFNRSMSYIRKPFVQRNREIVYGFRNLLSARDYLLDLCLNGRLQASSAKMRTFISIQLHKRGRLFENEVANALETLQGVSVIRGLEQIQYEGHKLKAPGDIDVLVADRRRRLLWLVECKDLATSRTAHEFSNEIKALVTGQGKRKSTIETHAARGEWASNHQLALLHQFGIHDDRRWRVELVIVIDTELVTPYISRTTIPIVRVQEARAAIAIGRFKPAGQALTKNTKEGGTPT